MTRKQELYLMMLHTGIVFVRNYQSQNKFRHWWPMRFGARQRIDIDCYEVAEFLHHMPLLVKEAEFTQSDIHFLNGQARSFYKRDTTKNHWVSGQFRSPIRQLFELVPKHLRAELKWAGPEIPSRTPAEQTEANEYLFWAVEESQNIENLRNALSDRPDINARNRGGKTALQIARGLGKMDYVEVLREAGAQE